MDIVHIDQGIHYNYEVEFAFYIRDATPPKPEVLLVRKQGADMFRYIKPMKLGRVIAPIKLQQELSIETTDVEYPWAFLLQ